jgi:hypothetical protein
MRRDTPGIPVEVLPEDGPGGDATSERKYAII